jgi:non-ribosomal peptide synthetase component E (peptide arylation enzyme)
MQPDEYHSLPAFPLNANGKIDRRKIYTTLFGE